MAAGISLKVAGLFYLICALGCGLATNLWFLIACRLLGGLAVGATSDTKPEHFQRPDVIELWLPFVDGLTYGMELSLKVAKTQVAFKYKAQPATQ